jgi:hypothetical protein
VLLRLRLQQEVLGRRLPDELLDPLGNVRVDRSGHCHTLLQQNSSSRHQDLIFTGTGNFSWTRNATLSAGVKFMERINVIPRILFNIKFC